METTKDEEKVKEKDPEVIKFEKVQKIEDSVSHYTSVMFLGYKNRKID